MTNTLNWDKNGNIYYTDSDGNLIQNQILFQERILNEIQKAKTIAQHLTPQERSDILMGGIAMLAPIKGLNYIGRVNTYNKIKQIYNLRKDWGIAYRSLSGKPEKAIEFLLKNKRGFVPNAMYKRGIGNIDFVWGDSKKGLQHIIQRRNNEGINGVEFIRQLPNNIRAGQIFKKNGHIDRNYILNNKTETSVKSKWNDKNRNWIVSAYNRKDSNKALPGFRTYEQNYFDKQQIPLSNFIESNYIIPYNSLNFNATNEFIKKLVEFDTKDAKHYNTNPSKKFQDMLLSK